MEKKGFRKGFQEAASIWYANHAKKTNIFHLAGTVQT